MQVIDPAQYQPNEDLYYNDGYVWVTSRRVVHGGGEISLKRVRGVRTRTVRAEDRMRNQFMLYLWGIGTFLLMMFSPLYTSRGGTFLDVIPLIIQFLFAGALVLIIVLFIALLVNRNKLPREPVYTISISYRFHSKTAIASRDQVYVERIAEAIEYAIASRNDTAYRMPIQPSIGRTSNVPSPTIKDNTLYAGEATFDFAELTLAKVSSMDQLSARSILILGLFTLGALSDYAHQYLEAPWNTYASFIRDVARFSIAFVILFIQWTAWGNIYTVEITARTGQRAIVFASTSKADATEVQQSIKQEMQTSQGAVTQTL